MEPPPDSPSLNGLAVGEFVSRGQLIGTEENRGAGARGTAEVVGRALAKRRRVDNVTWKVGELEKVAEPAYRFMHRYKLVKPGTWQVTPGPETPADSEPTVPASPAPLTPSGLVLHGTLWVSKVNCVTLSARAARSHSSMRPARIFER